MTWLQPWMLWGALGAAIPIVIHLIHRRRPRRQAFAAIELLLRSVERVDRRWRLQRILLLASRVAIIALLAAAAARPAPVADAAAPVVEGPRRVGIVIDASASMRARYDDATSFGRAQDAARDRVGRLGPEDLAVVVVAGPEAELATPEPTGDRRALRRALERAAPSFGGCDLGRATSLAVRALDPGPEAPDVPVEIVVISDWASSAVQTAADLSLASGSRARLELVDAVGATRPEDRDNAAITSVQLEPGPGGRAMTLQLQVRTRRFAPPEAELQAVALDLVEDGETVASTMVDLAPGAIADRRVEHAFETAGPKHLEVRLEPDRLDVDDRRFLTAEVRRRVRVLLVDGDPSGVAKEDEVFYVDKAARAGLADHPVPRVLTADELPSVELSEYDVVALVGLPALAPEDAARLDRHVRDGGGLLVAVGEATDPVAVGAELRVLPRPFRGLKALTDGAGSGRPARFEAPDLDHPIFAVFRGEALGGLASTRTSAFALLEPGGSASMRVPLRFEGGAPAMVTAEAGRGRVAVWTTSLDRDLSDFPIRPAFVPWVRRTLLWLGRALHEADERRTVVGDVRTIRAPGGAGAVRVIDPRGQATVVPVDGTSAAFAATQLPGHYRVEVDGLGPLPSEDFAVNVDGAESDLSPLTLVDAETVLTGRTTAGTRAATFAEAKRDDGWSSATWVTLLLGLMALSFGLESVLTTRSIGRV